MVRVGTCKDCGTRFKVPEATRATKARCKKCGGTVEIPPAESGGETPAGSKAGSGSTAPASAPRRAAVPSPPAARPKGAASAGRVPPGKGVAAGKGVVPRKGVAASAASVRRAAPSKVPPTKGRTAARSTPLEHSRPSGARRAKVAARDKPARSSERKPRGARGGTARAEKTKGSPVLLIVIAAVVLLGAGGAWFFWFKGAQPAADSTAAEAAADGSGTSASSSESAAGTESGAQPVLIDAPTAPSGNDADGPAAGVGGETAPPAAMAPPPASKTSADPDEPVDPVIAFDPLPPNPGISQEQHDEWAVLIRSYYLESPPPRRAKGMRVQLDALDPVDAAPAYVNALIGLDMRDEIDVRDAFKLVDDWQEKQGGKMHFYFPDASRMEEKDISDRAKVAQGWRSAWAAKQTDPTLIEAFRLAVAEKLAENAAGGN